MPTAEARVLSRAQTDPAWFARDVLGVELWSAQRNILQSVRDNRRTAVRSCHGIGKTFTAATCALWWLYSFPESRVVTTAPTWSQVEKQLWHEIGRLHAKAAFPLGGRCLTTDLKLDDGRYAVGLSTDPHRKEAFQGHHAPNLLLIFDEASGVPQPIYEAGEGYMTATGARWLMIGNPTQPGGEFFNAFHRAQVQYSTLHVGFEDTPAFTGEKVSGKVADSLIGQAWVEERRQAWGEGSPMWEVRVEGNFPSGTDTTVISLAAVTEAQARDLPPNEDRDQGVVGCDVARFGSDETVIATRVGDRVRIAKHYVGRDLMTTVGEILQVAKNLPCEGMPRIVIDDDGVGGGVTDRLREQGYDVHPFRAGSRAYTPSLYPNRRSEAWFQVAEVLPGLDLDGDEQLAADLTAPMYKLDSAGRRVVEPKDDTKKRIGRSPDRADAVLLVVANVAPQVTEGPNLWT